MSVILLLGLLGLGLLGLPRITSICICFHSINDLNLGFSRSGGSMDLNI